MKMVRIEIVKSLLSDIKKGFDRNEANKVLDIIASLESNPRKGKLLGSVGGLVIKELKYKNYRFYFITDGFKLKCFDEDGLVDILLRFVRMSDKKSQQKVIDEIRHILRTIGPSGFS